MSDQFDYEALQAFYQHSAIPLFVIAATGQLVLNTTDTPLNPLPGQSLMSLIPAEALAATSNVDDASERASSS